MYEGRRKKVSMLKMTMLADLRIDPTLNDGLGSS